MTTPPDTHKPLPRPRDRAEALIASARQERPSTGRFPMWSRCWPPDPDSPAARAERRSRRTPDGISYNYGDGAAAALRPPSPIRRLSHRCGGCTRTP